MHLCIYAHAYISYFTSRINMSLVDRVRFYRLDGSRLHVTSQISKIYQKDTTNVKKMSKQC